MKKYNQPEKNQCCLTSPTKSAQTSVIIEKSSQYVNIKFNTININVAIYFKI